MHLRLHCSRASAAMPIVLAAGLPRVGPCTQAMILFSFTSPHATLTARLRDAVRGCALTDGQSHSLIHRIECAPPHLRTVEWVCLWMI